MQSWGTRSRWDVRETGPEPTKSGVIGLLGCALGLPRRDPGLLELDRSLRFGVRLDRPGRIETDFQTVTGRHRQANGKLRPDDFTVLSPRDYLHDAAFLVILEGDRPLLERLDAALRAPFWPLFLGRKSCPPTRPVSLGLRDAYASLDAALIHEPLLDRADARAAPYTAWAEPIDVAPGDVARSDKLRDDPLRLYDSRFARRLTVPADRP